MRAPIPAAVLALGLGTAIAATAPAQQPAAPDRPPTIRGTVAALEGAHLRVATESGEQRVTLVEPLSIIGVRRAALADVTPGSFVGTAARTDPDGTSRALEVHIFPESMRGTGEGHRPWVRPGTTMTNATVEGVVQRAEGPVLTLGYPGGEVRVLVTPETPVVRLEPGAPGLLVPGADVMVFRVARGADGTLQASRVTVGVEGARLPM